MLKNNLNISSILLKMLKQIFFIISVKLPSILFLLFLFLTFSSHPSTVPHPCPPCLGSESLKGSLKAQPAPAPTSLALFPSLSCLFHPVTSVLSLLTCFSFPSTHYPDPQDKARLKLPDLQGFLPQRRQGGYQQVNNVLPLTKQTHIW